MKVNNWMTISNKGACRLTKGKPHLGCNEVSVFLEINLPDALFERPHLEARITVPNEAVGNDIINSVVANNVQDAIHQATGLSLSISVVNPIDEQEEKQPAQ